VVVTPYPSTIAASSPRSSRRGTTRPRSYTIPLVDLANDSSRQVIVDQEPGQYLGHPTTVLLGWRTMIAVYPKGHGRAIVLKRSEDGGKTWSARLPTPESWATSKETPTIHRGRCGREAARALSGLYPIRESVSGTTGRPGRAEADRDLAHRRHGPVVERTGSGRYMALFHDAVDT
jgi:hypothetical protein